MLMLILLSLLVTATTVSLIGFSLDLFWFDYGAAKAKGYQDGAAKYPAKEMIQDFLCYGRGRYIMLTAIVFAAACATTLVWLGGVLV